MKQHEREITYRLYEDTCKVTREQEGKRNKYLIASVLFLFLFSMLSINPDEMYRWVQEVVKTKSGGEFSLSVSYTKAFLLVVFMYCQISYYQKCVYIERQYLYIGKLENRIGITREGVSYNSGQPVLLLIIGWFYKYLLPIIVFVVLSFSIWRKGDSPVFFVFNNVILLYYVIVSALYVFFQRKTEKEYETDS